VGAGTACVGGIDHQPRGLTSSAFTVDVAILPSVTLTTPIEGAVVIPGSDAVVWSAYTDSDPMGEYAF